MKKTPVSATNLTDKMRKALQELEAREDSVGLGLGRPTKQRLVKHGLAQWVGPVTDAGKPIASGPTPGLPENFREFDWDQDVRITDAGRQALLPPRSRSPS